jgi:hypothetical protein
MSCPICHKRPPKRFCPSKSEKICAVCCGEGREITIDCPSDCPHLLAAHRYEAEHRRPIAREDFPYPDLEVPPDFVYEHWPVLTGLAGVILDLQRENDHFNDGSAIAALEAMAETYRTLGTGIYYERPPDGILARAIYSRLGEFLQQFRQQQSQRAGFASLKDSEIFWLFVFLLRVASQETTGRPLSRAFLAFLRARFQPPAGDSGAAEKEPSRIILP